ncbi:polysaccharide biosynthesis/export family protein [Henriciella marina]|uniref:polysaccharide biosynthesis/export family protein n=1 Tax=Henriciella marina TaxID=453851 RepID=UPI0003711477|nr:polysaccharide biosynthesis/export family protein [Henriciella marina]
MRRFLTSFLLVAAVFVTACASDSGSTFTDRQLPAPDTTKMVQNDNMSIGPSDMLGIKVFGVNELNGSYQVDHLGRIKMPLIGEVTAQGYTALQFASVLERRLEDNYLQDADVTVSLQESRNEQITVDGSVQKPGMIAVNGQLGLLQAVAIAGGPTEGANPRNVIVFRQVDGEQVGASYDLVAIRNGNAENPKVFGNDIIVVDGSEARRARGELLRTIPLLSFFLIL